MIMGYLHKSWQQVCVSVYLHTSSYCLFGTAALAILGHKWPDNNFILLSMTTWNAFCLYCLVLHTWTTQIADSGDTADCRHNMLQFNETWDCLLSPNIRIKWIVSWISKLFKVKSDRIIGSCLQRIIIVAVKVKEEYILTPNKHSINST